MNTKRKAKPRKPRRIVLGMMDLRGVSRGSENCPCIKHSLKYSYPKLPLGIKVQLVAEVLQ